MARKKAAPPLCVLRNSGLTLYLPPGARSDKSRLWGPVAAAPGTTAILFVEVKWILQSVGRVQERKSGRERGPGGRRQTRVRLARDVSTPF